MENEKKKKAQLVKLQNDTAELEDKIRLMKVENENVDNIPDIDNRIIRLDREIHIMVQKKQEQDSFIDALSVRRDGLKLKLEEFRMNHPIE